MDSVLVSVIMANYKTKIEYLQEAINSILSQTYTNFELLVIDDCSQDGSVDYIKSIKDDRIKIFINENNRGPAVTRNRGLEEAKGKYIAIMDSDDIALPTRLEKQVEFMENHTDVFVCGTWFEKFGTINMVRKPIIDDFEYYRCQLLFSNTPRTICNSSSMIRKSMLDQYNIRYDTSLEKTEDYGLWTVCSKFGRFAILEEVLLKYRVHEHQISTQETSEQMEYADLISRRQLQALNIEFCEQEPRWRYDIVESKDDYLLFYKWLNQIISGNQKYQYYDQEVLIKYCDDKLSNAIKRLKTKEKAKVLLSTNAHTVRLYIKLFKKFIINRVK